MARFPSPNTFGPRTYEMQYESRADTVTVARFFNAVYAWMAAGLALTAVVAWYVSTRPDLMMQIFRGPVLIGLIIVELALVFVVAAAVNKINAAVATGLFLLYSALNGLTLSAIFIVYAQATIASAFIITAGTFGAMSVWGFVTKRDLSGMGSILFMALIGLVLASIVNMFWANSMLTMLINYAGVLIFVGLTAYDTQKLKAIAVATAHDAAMSARLSVSGALTLYLDFVNLFLFLLRILGRRD
ncbi:MAG TPA: Bax inhibitor-1/YccA family protein [Tepidisphaeraceae bacterium]|nr:Bax inhibitor-1/YccA family protein [Tepidisphaeraceae bacterium]